MAKNPVPTSSPAATTPSVGKAPNHNAEILGVNIGMTALALIIVILRIFTRLKITRALGWDDLFAVLAVVVAIAMAAINGFSVHYGMGKHMRDIGSEHERVVEKLHWICLILYPVCLGFAKLSILFLLHRIAPNITFRRTIYGFMAFVVSLSISTSIAIVFQCIPVQAIFDPVTDTTVCVERASLYYSTSAFNILTDVALVILPLPLLFKVQISRKQKVVLIGIFSLGGLGSVGSIIRLTTLMAMARSSDPPWAMAHFSVWTCTEVSLAIICASLPPLKPLLNRYAPHLLSSSFRQSQRAGSKYWPKGSSRSGRTSYQLTNVSASGKGTRRGSVRQGITVSQVPVPGFKGDEESEELIGPEDGIINTTNINVKFGENTWENQSHSDASVEKLAPAHLKPQS